MLRATPAWVAIVVLVVAGCLSGVATAGDTANRHLFGFSENARWFAFEEFGIQDGSGFPYSNIYIIDTHKDRWAPGTPVRVRIDSEDASVITASRRARAKARDKLDKYGVNVPGRLRASFPLSELNNAEGDPTMVATFQPGYPYGPHFTVRATEFEGRKSDECFEDDRPVGFFLEAQLRDGPLSELYRDKTIPKSRGCPLGYSISDIYDAPEGANSNVTIMLMYVRTRGFEGPDARFLAIPVRLPSEQ